MAFQRIISSVSRAIEPYKTALLFLVKFLGIYLVFNLLYGIWFESYSPLADPVTHWVTGQTIWVLDFFYNGLDYDYYPYEPLVWMALDNQVILNAFEGCNGINVIILYIAFLVAYKGPWKDTVLFAVVGTVVIHIANIARIAILFVIAERFQSYLYFTHKYLFTGTIYAVIFFIWYLWVRKINRLNRETDEPVSQEVT